MAMKSSFKSMTLCLLVICFVCSALLAGVYAITKDPIAAAQQKKITDAVSAVAPESDSVSDKQTISVAGKDYSYYTASLDGQTAGYVIESSTTGFGGALRLMVGIGVDGVISGTSVLECNETPGLGAKCKNEDFYGQFVGFDSNVKVLKVGKDGGDVDAITASTITSRAYTLAVANAVEVFKAIKEESNE